MTAQPAHDRLDSRRFWQVQSVYDPDGLGGDFAYTIGLCSRGLPDLHLYARPSLGDDPGVDWKLSSKDCCGVLDELGFLLLRGEIAVGATVSREYDGGLARVEYRVDPPGDREELEAYGVPPGCDVLPVRWSLHRKPEGSLEPLTDDQVDRARATYLELVNGLDGKRRAPRGWALPSEPTFEPDQRYGPLTPLVLARAAHMWQAEPETTDRFIVISADVDQWVSLSYPACRALAIGRPAGRTGSLEALTSDLDVLMPWHAHSPGRRGWRQVVDDFYDEETGRATGVRRRQVDQNLRGMYESAVRSCLLVQAVADIADEELRLHGLGPWCAALSPDGHPGRGWFASSAVLEVVRRLLAGLSSEQLRMLGPFHQISLGAGFIDTAQVRRYAELEERLSTYATISAAGCPSVLELLPESPVTRELGARLARDPRGDGLDDLSGWLTCLTAALVHRPRLTSDDVRIFADGVRGVLPDLERVLNMPL